jgi:hypothetical protein
MTFLLAGLAYGVLSVPGIGWGLPSRERLRHYGASFDEVVGSGEHRLFVTGPLQSYQVDECSLLLPLSRMDPSRLKLNPGWFHWGSFHLYLVGVVLFCAKLAGLITLSTDRHFYLDHPDQLATIYQIARWVSWTMGLASIGLFTIMARRVTRGFALPLLSVALVATAPLVVLYGRFATPDIAVLFWVLLSACLAGCGGTTVPTRIPLLLAFAFAGLAASVKFYGGLAVVFPLLHTARSRRRLAMAGLGCAAAAFIIGSPYALLDWQGFRADLVWQWNHVREGHGVTFLGTRTSFLHHWLETLPAATSPLTTSLMALSLIANLVRVRSSRLSVAVFLVLFWIQLARSPLKFARYVLPVLPFQVLVLAWLIHELKWKPARTAGVVLMASAALCQGVLAWGHAQALRGPDVRDRAASWLEAHGTRGDVVALPGRPYFATPPVSAGLFELTIMPLDARIIEARNPRWFVLTDYDTEPLDRAPEALPEARAAVDLLLRSDGQRRTVREFSSAPRPPLVVAWGRRLLPHDMRYHCPTVWIIGA